jgi:hypothetical protein
VTLLYPLLTSLLKLGLNFLIDECNDCKLPRIYIYINKITLINCARAGLGLRGKMTINGKPSPKKKKKKLLRQATVKTHCTPTF